jgi:hypothetical protein
MRVNDGDVNRSRSGRRRQQRQINDEVREVGVS